MTDDIKALVALPAVGGELGKAIKRLREYASALDGDAYANINEPNLREDIELVCSAAQPASPLRGRDHSAWLIEVSEPEGPEYFQLVDDDNWSSDHDTALHFARKQDAEKYIEDVGWTRARAVEHMWPASPSEQPAAAPMPWIDAEEGDVS